MRRIEVELAGCASLVRGYGSREMVEQITGRAPVWVRSAGAWSVQEHTARDVVGLAESRGYDITITGLPVPDRQQVVHVHHLPETPEVEEVGLW